MKKADAGKTKIITVSKAECEILTGKACPSPCDIASSVVKMLDSSGITSGDENVSLDIFEAGDEYQLFITVTGAEDVLNYQPRGDNVDPEFFKRTENEKYIYRFREIDDLLLACGALCEAGIGASALTDGSDVYLCVASDTHIPEEFAAKKLSRRDALGLYDRCRTLPFGTDMLSRLAPSAKQSCNKNDLSIDLL